MRAFLPLLLALVAGCGGEERRDMSANEVAAALEGLAIAPGLWEVASDVVNVSAPNLPIEARDGMIGPRRRDRTCLTPEEAVRPSARFLDGQSDARCAYIDFAMEGGRMIGTMRCRESQDEETLARMRGNYARDGFRLDMMIDARLPDGATMRIETRTTGRRLGPCPDEAGERREEREDR